MKRPPKLLAVASGGGHWTQLNLLHDAFAGFDLHFITTTINHSADHSKPSIKKVIDADSSTKLKLLLMAIQVFSLTLWHRPHTVISTGAAPGFFAILTGKLIGARTIWIDSMANYNQMSLSGRQARRFCDLCLTQWPDLANGKDIKYAGSLL